MPLPLDLVAVTRRAHQEVQYELDRAFHERVANAIAPQARSVFCLAVSQYRRVLVADPVNPRALQQLAAYGDVFVASCH